MVSGGVNFGEKSSRQRGRAGCRDTVRASIFANAIPNQETWGVLLRVCVRFALRKSPVTNDTHAGIQLMDYRSKVRARRRRAHFFRFFLFFHILVPTTPLSGRERNRQCAWSGES